MIRVNRDRVPPPPEFEMEKAKAIDHARNMLQLKGASSARSMARVAHRSSETRHQLMKVFHGKCAYCESPVESAGAGVIDDFRPKSGARGHAETEDSWRYSRHYWWIAFDWRNLYLACPRCNQSKADWFPVVGERAQEEAPWEELEQEGRLFIDPCIDDPETYLDCDDRGLLFPKSKDQILGALLEYAVTPDRIERVAAHRGERTIELIGLNRSELVDARRRRIEEFRSALLAGIAPAETPRRFLEDDGPYAMACRAFYRRFQEERGEAVPGSPDEAAVRQLEVEQLEKVRVEEDSVLPAMDRVTACVESITLENFQPFEKVVLKLSIDEFAVEPEPIGRDRAGEDERNSLEPESRMPWQVMLGTNGSGKSSLLKAVALGLAGEERAQELVDLWGVEPRDLKRRPSEDEDDSGPLRVSLELSGPLRRITYVLGDGRIVFEEGAEGVATVVRGYGTSRLPPRKGQKLPKSVPLSNMENLFDPHATLIDAEAWLKARDDPTFVRAANALADLFQLSPGAVYRDPETEEIRVRREESEDPLTHLSDGYLALTGLVADLMSAVPAGVDDFRRETGIVLIDELGVHLHPRWRMSVVAGLRKAFPKFQFLATTHEPLCLRGLRDGEVTLVQRWPKGVSTLDRDVPPVSGMRIDQLLTSRHFGLQTTIDPALDDKFKEYYELLAKQREQPLVEAEEDRLRDLKRELDRHRVLGYTRRDQLVYEFIDEFLSQEGTPDPTKLRGLKAETKRKVLQVWNRVELAEQR